MKIKKPVLIFIILSLLITPLYSCNKKASGSFVKSAWEMTEDGWVYIFNYDDTYDGKHSSDMIHYSFMGINLRYRYDDDYIQTIVHDASDSPGGVPFTQRLIPSCLIAGSGPEAEARDMELINNGILDPNKDLTNEELLALDPDDYEFESIDKKMFFRLIHEALTGDPPENKQDSSYWDKPAWALYSEQMYIDDYKIQIGFIQSMGYIDEVYIDVLYPTGDGYCDYVQLSDMVEDGSATKEQREAFEKIQTIVNACKEEECYIAGQIRIRTRRSPG